MNCSNRVSVILMMMKENINRNRERCCRETDFGKESIPADMVIAVGLVSLMILRGKSKGIG